MCWSLDDLAQLGPGFGQAARFGLVIVYDTTIPPEPLSAL